MPIQLEAEGQTDVGQHREQNEDSFSYKIVTRPDGTHVGVFVVADGIGGHLAGEVASDMAVKTILQELASWLDPDQELPEHAQAAESLRQAIEQAHATITNMSKQNPSARGAGTTVTCGIIIDQFGYIANVGDSRTYVLRGDHFEQITTDHSLVARLVDTGQITADEIYTHPQRNLIYRSLGGNNPTADVDVFAYEAEPGDQLLFCSDGLWEMVRNDQQVQILTKATTAAEACAELVAQANRNGGEDNITALVVRIS